MPPAPHPLKKPLKPLHTAVSLPTPQKNLNHRQMLCHAWQSPAVRARSLALGTARIINIVILALKLCLSLLESGSANSVPVSPDYEDLSITTTIKLLRSHIRGIQGQKFSVLGRHCLTKYCHNPWCHKQEFCLCGHIIDHPSR